MSEGTLFFDRGFIRVRRVRFQKGKKPLCASLPGVIEGKLDAGIPVKFQSTEKRPIAGLHPEPPCCPL